MGEILAHAMARGKGVGDRRAGVGRAGIIGELRPDAQRQRQRGGDHRPVRVQPVADPRANLRQ